MRSRAVDQYYYYRTQTKRVELKTVTDFGFCFDFRITIDKRRHRLSSKRASYITNTKIIY